MTAFRFRLGPVLRLQQGLARLEENRLAKLHGERVANENQRAELRRIGEQIRRTVLAELARGSVAVEVQLAGALLETRRSVDEALRWERERLEGEIAAQRERYSSARREVQKLEQLREGEMQNWNVEQRRQEQKFNDELFLERRRTSAKL